MLEDFPGTAASGPAPEGPPARDPLPGALRAVWFLVPAVLLLYDVLLAGWNLALRSLAGGGLGMAFAWLPWLLHTGLVFGLAAWIWSRRRWAPGVQAALLAAAALPLLRFGVSQALAFTGFYRSGGVGGMLTLLLGPCFALALAALVATLDLGARDPDRPARTLGALAAAGAAALAGGWFTWALLPLLASLTGSGLARRIAEPGETPDPASPQALRTTGWLALGAAAAAGIVPLVGLLKFRGAEGLLLGSEGLALAVSAATWNVLGARWARGRREGRPLRIIAWLLLAVPVLLVLLLVVLLLLFRPRLF